MSKQKMTPEKKNVISNLLEAFDIKTKADLQDALKLLLCSTIQEVLEIVNILRKKDHLDTMRGPPINFAKNVIRVFTRKCAS